MPGRLRFHRHNGFRWRLVLTEAKPTYPGYNEKCWAQLPKPGFQALLVLLEALRSANLLLLRTTARAEWQRLGVHGEQGSETFELMVRKLAGHDLAHLDQLRQALGG